MKSTLRVLEFDMLLDMVQRKCKIDLCQGQVRPLAAFETIGHSKIAHGLDVVTRVVLQYARDQSPLHQLFHEL